MARAILLSLALAMTSALPGCGKRAEPALAPAPIVDPPPDAPPAPDAAPPAIDAGPVVGEAHARAVLARRFRAAGLRIREDVTVAGVTLDGCDPERQVGYEYVAVAERGRDLTDETRAALAAADGWRVLIIEATDLAGLTGRVDEFLAELPSRSGSDR